MKGGYSLINFSKVTFTTGGSAQTVEGAFNQIANTLKRVVISGMTVDGKLLADTSVTFELNDGKYETIFNEKKITVTNKDKVTVTAVGGGEDAVTDVKVNGTSVVSDGVAAITITDPTLEVNSAAEADICTFKALSGISFTIDAPLKFKTDTVGDVSNVLVQDGSDSTTSVSLSTDTKITLVKSGDTFFGVINASFKKYLLEIIPTSNSYKLFYVSGGDKLIPGSPVSRQYTVASVEIKYYKFK